MLDLVMIYAGALVIILWGLAHIIIPTKDIIAGFGAISTDNKRILLMEWIMEGLSLCFIGVLVASIAAWVGTDSLASTVVYRLSALMLLVMAGVSLFTGARTAILPMKLCPLIFTAVAVFFSCPPCGDEAEASPIFKLNTDDPRQGKLVLNDVKTRMLSKRGKDWNQC